MEAIVKKIELKKISNKKLKRKEKESPYVGLQQ